jgi:uncharacterized protein (TIGR00369 family)
MNTPDILDELALAGWRQHTPRGFTGIVGPLWSRRHDNMLSFGILAGNQHLNPAGYVHGGLLATLLDHTLSTVAWEAAERTPCVTVQMDVQFLAAVKSGQFVDGRASVVSTTRSLIFMRGDLLVEGTPVASGSGVFKALRAP